MVFAGMFRAEALKSALLFLLVLLFLFANMGINRHVVHTGVEKLITVDHQVRRELTRAERENLKTSVLSGRGDLITNPPQEAAGISRHQDIVVDSYPISDSPTQVQPKSIILDSSPVLNL